MPTRTGGKLFRFPPSQPSSPARPHAWPVYLSPYRPSNRATRGRRHPRGFPPPTTLGAHRGIASGSALAFRPSIAAHLESGSSSSPSGAPSIPATSASRSARPPASARSSATATASSSLLTSRHRARCRVSHGSCATCIRSACGRISIMGSSTRVSHQGWLPQTSPVALAMSIRRCRLWRRGGRPVTRCFLNEAEAGDAVAVAASAVMSADAVLWPGGADHQRRQARCERVFRGIPTEQSFDRENGAVWSAVLGSPETCRAEGRHELSRPGGHPVRPNVRHAGPDARPGRDQHRAPWPPGLAASAGCSAEPASSTSFPHHLRPGCRGQECAGDLASWAGTRDEGEPW
jgi:hypothetical protein